ncbi:Glycosyltransferase involved in cell wall bisynthesis [Streptomyces zhaozhouensis]|uniref:Glycosyltransferase involved in cell wall bisynthesis n=1 Tax=Streptomyces zhaozhouensis TaxID=1300267 RepID=A0A286DRS1_9ACTN|nr:Glycosyltransferase involved in cell wall bisynthesis [Streptomyces zhaozhouensis]
MVSGDGLPVSGLLTVLRNVVHLGREMGVVESPITADLGYSWRPDKPACYPRGLPDSRYPDFLRVRKDTPAASDGLAAELLALREEVAAPTGRGPDWRAALDARIEAVAEPYEAYFRDWFAEEDVDWVWALNMTLSDAVPVTLALHRAAAGRWGPGRRPGGVLFWDHDLFGSYAVREHGARVYPVAPGEVTPLPGGEPGHLWAVVSDDLAKEAAGYPTSAVPTVVPNVLPTIPEGGLDARHLAFLRGIGVPPERPVVVAPVRVFRVKGVEISLALLRAVREESARRGEPAPHLLVFGSMAEDPEYAAEVRVAAAELGVADAVTFLDGVPLESHRDAGGAWRLDEIDLLRVAAATGGGVFFTPNRTDVESVGLGPALAAVAGVPCAVTGFAALRAVYGDDHRLAVVGEGERGLAEAARDFVALTAGNRSGDGEVRAALARNRRQMARFFPEEPWRRLLERMTEPLDGRPVRAAVSAPEAEA